MSIMIKSLHILLVGIAMLAPLAFGQMGSLSDHDGVLQAKFALELSKPNAEAEEPETLSLTSGDLVHEYGFPKTARVYWVFNFDGLRIQGGLVVADSDTGKIHATIAKATQLSLNDFLDDSAALDAEAFEDSGMDSMLSADYRLSFDLDGLQVSVSALIEFEFTQARNVSFLRLVSVGGMHGEGMFDDQSRVTVTGGGITASGIIANLD